MNNLPRVARGAERPRLERATSLLQVRRPNHYANTPIFNTQYVISVASFSRQSTVRVLTVLITTLITIENTQNHTKN